ncbi:MAG: HAD-IIB family hydrolase [Terrabacter sp.]|nr:HAD-IIB family hydrolase [Terrabacter sp.]
MTRAALPKLIATDLDGTLLGPDHSSSPRTRRAMEAVKDHGIALIGITGRGPRLLDICRDEVPLADYLVMAQGSHIYRLGPGEPELRHQAHLPGETIVRVLEMLEAEVGFLELVVENDGTADAPLLANPVPSDWAFPVTLAEAERSHALSQPVLKGFVRSPNVHIDVVLDAARRLVPESWCMLTEAGIGYVELCPPGHDKGTGLAFVAQELGISADDVLVFGDARNDLPMFGWAGASVAMANAHPDVIAAARARTLSNREDGVAIYLEGLLR